MTVLVLGGYGLIGAEICQALADAGHEVFVAGRDSRAAARRLPALRFVQLDMAKLTTAADWTPYLNNVQVVVNCAGALQDSARDALENLHHHAVAALAEATKLRNIKTVQISAIGADVTSPIAFLSSKARGDAALLDSGADAIVLRPGLVHAQSAYGGTALIRLLTAVPVIQPLALPRAQMQSVSAHDVAAAVVCAVAGDVPSGQIFDLVEDQPQPLAEIVRAHRAALGFAPARHVWTAPNWLVSLTSCGADLLGRLGWRSPLRSTATQVLNHDLIGDPIRWSDLHKPLPDMQNILSGLHLGPEHRLQARMALFMPLCVAMLVLFWALSGVIGVISLPQAAAHLQAQGWDVGLSRLSVLFWSVVDLSLAAALLWRPMARWACLGMAAVCLIYLGLSTLVSPSLWLDPLGPLVKIGPAFLLALITWALLEER